MGKAEVSIVDFLFESGALKDTPRSGWQTIGIKQPESVADHSFRVALVGWVLAKLEKADEGKVVRMCLLHDLEESRLGDLHTVNRKYLVEKGSAYADIFKGLFCGKEFGELVKELKGMKTKEAIIARDADRLEMVFQAKEYADQGKRYVGDWIRTGTESLKTESAKRIAREVVGRDSRAWLFGIK